MERTRNEKFIIFLISVACIGLTIESIVMNWEFWVPPLIILGIILIWVMNLMEKPAYEIRVVSYLIFSMTAVFFHGVHETSFFDVALVAVLVMTAFSFSERAYMIKLIFIEYIIIMIIQLVMAHDSGSIDFDTLNMSRVILHAAIVVLMYLGCAKSVNDRTEAMRLDMEKNERIEAYDIDMEDFLSNISHELRTPVNVVKGMSDILIKRNVGYEADAIKDAGIRLTYQIENIQDYTECKRNKVILEEEEYMSTSLINDVVTSFRLYEESKKLELIVDIDPNVPTRMIGDVNKLHKIFRHLLENAVKFTKNGGIYVRMFTEKEDYGVNLCLEVTDTGIGMDRRTVRALAEGMYQVNKRRDRSSGGVGLGLFIVYGFTHNMGGFVMVESQKKNGTTVRITVPQRVADATPCIELKDSYTGDVVFHLRSDKYKNPKVRDFYRTMAMNLISGIKVSVYQAETSKEIERLMDKLNVETILMGQEEYEENSSYFDELSRKNILVAVSASDGFAPNSGSKVMVMPKPLYAYPLMKLINEGRVDIDFTDGAVKPVFTGVRALIVDDEPMNLVVATGLFKDYELIIDTAGSGMEAIEKYRVNDYDVVFMDHMMPEMDGVEAMKHIKACAADMHKNVIVIALTANAVSGAREMFMREGFDGFIAKPINLADFERVMVRELKESDDDRKGTGL